MKRMEHIGIAVSSLQDAIPLYERLLGTPCYKTERVESEGVVTAFFRQGEVKVELLEAVGAASPVTRFLEKRGAGIHHVAFLVDDIVAEMARLKKEGFALLSEQPRAGADGKWVCFVHPKSTGGVLVELCQERDQTERPV
jgi:methylmalonyl-CoA/ethylmalonyl-CoA epimerase